MIAGRVFIGSILIWAAATQSVFALGFGDSIFRAMEIELNRSMDRLKFENFKSPYFISYHVIHSSDTSVNIRFGEMTLNQTYLNRSAYVELRYGGHALDNTDEHYRGVSDTVPLGDRIDAFRHILWLITDQAYKQAVKDYLQKQGRKVSEVEVEKVPDFSREKPNQTIVPFAEPSISMELVIQRLTNASREFKNYRELIDHGISFRRNQRMIYYLNSEGTKIIMPQGGNPNFIYIWAKSQSDDGMNLEMSRTFSFKNFDQFPAESELKKTVRKMADQLIKLRAAPLADPYNAPAILDSESTGVLFHEALGHRLEGERQRDEEEGQTFKGQMGKSIIPEFLSVEDDPTLTNWGGNDLNGHYVFDEEGVEARKVVLVRNGILSNYLMSRRPISGFINSNGHGRAQFGKDPIGRMSNLLVKSSKKVTGLRMKEMLIEECKKQNKPYGLIIRRIRSGDTSTARGRYQAFRGTPEEVYLVDSVTGEETLVRGVELVGTPLITVNKIIATDDEFLANNAFCGAESGLIPVSTVAPSALVREVELQRLREDKQRPPILPPPLFDGNKLP